MNRRGRRRDDTGQALIELALVLPLVALLLAAAFNGWSGVQLALRLTSAARAGAIAAAYDLAHNTGSPLTDATSAVNAEEGVSGVYQNTNPGATDYVSMSPLTPENVNGATIQVVTIAISGASFTLIPFVGNFAVTTHATADVS